MQRFCHNCGDPVEEGEIFCDKCGTKIINEEDGQSRSFSNNNEIYTNNYSDNLSSRNNLQFQQVQQTKTKKTSGFYKFIRVFSTITAILTVLIIILVIIGNLVDKPDPIVAPTPTPVASIAPTSTPAATPKPTATTNNSVSSNKALVTWTADLNSYATYSDTEKKVNVDYSVVLKNGGTGNASNINVYFDPVPNDANAAYVGIKEKTIVNLNENIPQVAAGATREVKTKFYYDNVQASTATQQYLQDLANRYVKLPVLVEWQENGKTYTQSLLTK